MINPLHPNISMHILLTVLCTSPKCGQGEFVEQSRGYLIGVISFILQTLNRHDNVFFPFHKNVLDDRFLFKFFSIYCVVVAAFIDIVVVLECQNCCKQHPSYFLSISNMSSKLVTIKLNQCM